MCCIHRRKGHLHSMHACFWMNGRHWQGFLRHGIPPPIKDRLLRTLRLKGPTNVRSGRPRKRRQFFLKKSKKSKDFPQGCQKSRFSPLPPKSIWFFLPKSGHFFGWLSRGCFIECAGAGFPPPPLKHHADLWAAICLTQRKGVRKTTKSMCESLGSDLNVFAPLALTINHLLLCTFPSPL